MLHAVIVYFISGSKSPQWSPGPSRRPCGMERSWQDLRPASSLRTQKAQKTLW